MISKLVVWGEDRKAALSRMRRALDEYTVRGIETNLPFHRRCFRHAAFVAGDYDTGFIARNAAELAPRADEAELDAAIIAAVLEAVTQSPATTKSPTGNGNGAPVVNGGSSEISGWRLQLRV